MNGWMDGWTARWISQVRREEADPTSTTTLLVILPVLDVELCLFV